MRLFTNIQELLATVPYRTGDKHLTPLSSQEPMHAKHAWDILTNALGLGHKLHNNRDYVNNIRCCTAHKRRREPRRKPGPKKISLKPVPRPDEPRIRGVVLLPVEVVAGCEVPVRR